MKKEDIRNLTLEELTAQFERWGEKPFRARQVFTWVHQKGIDHFASMKNISAPLQKMLCEHFSLEPLKVLGHPVSKDSTEKILFELHDGKMIETAVIPAKGRVTVCVSTQVGCKFACSFCASGAKGWNRNLSAAEIVSQVLYVRHHLGRAVTHVVFMGIGEPLDNYDNALKSIRLLNCEQGLNIGARRITISTCGLPEKIRQLAKEGMQFELAVSLHGFDDTSRVPLMPVAKRYPLKDLMQACREYVKQTNRQITFEYILIKDQTCHAHAADVLARLLKGLICKLNLIPLNPVKGVDRPELSRAEILDFQEKLKEQGVHSTLRRSRGRDIDAACGQLRQQFLK